MSESEIPYEELEAARLRGWVDDVDPVDVEAVLEWLDDHNLLTESGAETRDAFWRLYVMDGDSDG